MGMKKFLLGLVGIVCALFAVPAWATLPAGYTELEYIESTGTQYINTGVGLNAANKITGKIAFTNLNNSLSYIVGGRLSSAVAVGYALYAVAHSGFTMYNATWPDQGVNISTNQILEFETVMKSGQQSFIVNGDTIVTGDRPISLDSNNISLFGLGSEYLASAKVYSLKIYDNNTLVRNFIPAKNSSGVIGMYDKVSNTFFTNAGTGSFVAGPVVDNSCRNLFNKYDPAMIVNGFLATVEGTGVNTTFRASNGDRSAIVKVEPNTTYTIQRYINGSAPYDRLRVAEAASFPVLENAYKVLANYADGTTRTATVTTSGNANYLIIYGVNGYTESALNKFKNALQVEQGSTATEYVPYCVTDIKIASTKYTETVFNPLNTALANAVATVNTVVTQTIAQAASIATLQSGKQTRPADNTECPAYKQCLLVEDEQGVPHWYQITDPFRDFVAPIIANNVAPASTTNQPGYTQLEYIESTGTQYIDTGIIATNWDWSVEFEMSVPQAGDMFFGAGRGLWASTDWGAQFGLANSSGKTNWGAGSGGMNVVISVLGVRTDTFYNYKITKEGLYVNGELKSQNTATESFSNSDLSLWICKTNNIGTSGYNKSASSWKYVRIYNANNALVFNGIPARRNSDNVIGMYDTVTKTFFANAGTGAFTAGPTVANTDVPANPTWAATWAANATTGVAAGTVYGEGLCNGVAGTESTAATSAQMSSANWSVDGANCWCRATGVEEYSAAPSSISWVFRYAGSSAADCAYGCASACTYGVSTYASFRSALFGM